jgi:OOP family OmpA-OmpF porin
MSRVVWFLFFCCFSPSMVIAQFGIYGPQETVGTGVNSAYYETNPVLSSDGKKLYFNRANHPNNIGGKSDAADIWYSNLLEDASWGPAINAGTPLNDADENILIGFMDKGRAMLVHHDTGFAFSYFVDGRWLKPTPFDIPFFTNKGPSKSASISYNGRYLVFSIESLGTYGVEDIYMTELLPDGNWAPLKNLGGTINTRFQEQTPFLAPDNKTLFFASNGHGGAGSFDLFMSERLDDSWRKWSEPKSLGPRVNSSGTEMTFNFLPDSEFAYMVSTQNSEGYSDIKRVKIASSTFLIDSTKVKREDIVELSPEQKQTLRAEELANMVTFKGKLLDRKSNLPLKGQIIFEADGGLAITAESNMDGTFNAKLPKDHIYELTVKSGNYFKIDTTFFVNDKFDEIKINPFYLEPLVVGNRIKLNNVLFYRSTEALVEGSEKELNLLAEMMRDNPSIVILLEGHTDNRGEFKLNLALSEKRVSVVKDYIISKGINASRIEGKGYGSTRPIAGNNSEANRKLNRRVEFEIIKN